jgi:hypothetical protein
MVNIAHVASAERAAPAMPAPAAAARNIAREPQPVTLQVSGARPLRLRADLLAEGNSWCLGTEAWHEVALYRRDGGEFAVAIRTFHKSADATDVHRAELFPTLDEALGFLEAFDPTCDLRVALDCADRRVSGVEIALRAAKLRQRADEVTRHWRALIGEMLLRLDTGGPD